MHHHGCVFLLLLGCLLVSPSYQHGILFSSFRVTSIVLQSSSSVMEERNSEAWYSRSTVSYSFFRFLPKGTKRKTTTCQSEMRRYRRLAGTFLDPGLLKPHSPQCPVMQPHTFSPTFVMPQCRTHLLFFEIECNTSLILSTPGATFPNTKLNDRSPQDSSGKKSHRKPSDGDASECTLPSTVRTHFPYAAMQPHLFCLKYKVQQPGVLHHPAIQLHTDSPTSLIAECGPRCFISNIEYNATYNPAHHPAIQLDTYRRTRFMSNREYSAIFPSFFFIHSYVALRTRYITFCYPAI